MKFNNKQYAQALYEALQDTAPKDQDTVIENFVQILKSHNALAEYENIIIAYETFEREQKGITEVEISTANPSTKINQSLINDLNKVISEETETSNKNESEITAEIFSLKLTDNAIKKVKEIMLTLSML